MKTFTRGFISSLFVRLLGLSLLLFWPIALPITMMRHKSIINGFTFWMDNVYNFIVTGTFWNI